MGTAKMGRPKKYEEEPVSWGLKTTRAGRDKIRALGKLHQKPASQVVMELVERSLHEAELQLQSQFHHRISATELCQMSKSERKRILAEQTELALQDYDVIPDGFDIVDD